MLSNLWSLAGLIMNITTITAIICITTLAVVAIANNINGVALSAAFIIIGGLGGYEIGRKRKPKEPKS